MQHKVLSTIARVWCKSILFNHVKNEDTKGLLSKAENEFVMLESLRIAEGIIEFPIRRTLAEIVREQQENTTVRPDGYLPEVSIGQKYRIDGEEYVLFDIRATNVDSSTDFIIACRFKSNSNFFEENIKNVIGNPEFELIVQP